MQNSPSTGRSIIAFPPGESGLATRDYTALTQHASLAMLVHSAVRSLHILHSLLEDSDEGARWDLPHLHTALVGVALNAKGEGGVLEPCTVVEGAGRIGQSNEQKEKVWLK